MDSSYERHKLNRLNEAYCPQRIEVLYPQNKRQKTPTHVFRKKSIDRRNVADAPLSPDALGIKSEYSTNIPSMPFPPGSVNTCMRQKQPLLRAE